MKKKSKPQIDFTKLRKGLTDAFRRGFKYVGIKRFITFDKMGVSQEGLYFKRLEFLGKPCVCGIACGGKTIISIQNSEFDHLIPLKSARTEEDVYKLNKLENFQWICIECNLKKSFN